MTTTQTRLDEALIAHLTAKLRYETDVSDVHAALESAAPGFVLIDTRGEAAWAQGRIPGAVHLPSRQIAARASEILDRGTPVVTYCWGPGCNGSTVAALALARLGFRVREMIGGFEYWAREGFGVQTDGGTRARPADPLTAPAGSPTCDC